MNPAVVVKGAKERKATRYGPVGHRSTVNFPSKPTERAVAFSFDEKT